jgi:hypothetical protein
VCGAAYVMSRLYTAAYMLSRYVLSPSLCRRLCTETACVQSPLMCGLSAYVFDALMYPAVYVLRRLCAD